MKRKSTGALSPEVRRRQEERYDPRHRYDVVIVGSGMSALSVGSLLAHAGQRVCLLEAHDRPGGFAHTFAMGGYEFCAQVHYVWGCAPGTPVYEFLRKLGLEREITWELLDPDGYDHMILPDGQRVRIPYGFERLAENVDAAYPGQREPVRRFCRVLEDIRREMRALPEGKIGWWQLLTQALHFPTLLRYRTRTLQQVFDACGLSIEAQATLIANAGDFMAPPEDLSIFAYAALFGGYNTGAYYPTHHFKHLTEGLAEFIADHEGCDVFYESEVTAFEREGRRIARVLTRDGREFRADRFICNMDPQRASHLIGREAFPRSTLRQLDYSYSPSGVILYLGLEGLDLRDHGFGNFNIWQLFQWDMNRIFAESLEDQRWDRPWVFMSTPTLHTEAPGVAPPGGQILELLTLASYDAFRGLKDEGYGHYARAKRAVAERLLDLVSEHHIPNLREHIKVKVVGTPVTHSDFCWAPRGNAYGSYLTPAQLGLSRLKAETPFENLWWCNASSGYAGVNGTIGTGMSLYMDLTGDRFFSHASSPTDEELLARLARGELARGQLARV
ncbi:MAG: phytoene desaturase family protein [Planctomycetota bacterium]